MKTVLLLTFFAFTFFACTSSEDTVTKKNIPPEVMKGKKINTPQKVYPKGYDVK